MKRVLVLTFVLLLSTAMFAQSRAILLNESFETLNAPQGWGVHGGGNANWNVRNTDKAGGSPCELEFFWDPNFVGISYMSMGTYDFTGIEGIVVSFKHYYENFENSASIGVATSSDGGATWNTAWTEEFSTTGRYVVNEYVTSPDMGKSNVMFALFFNGDSYSINYWCFDDIMMYVQEENDLNLFSIDVADAISLGNTEIAFTVSNLGTEKVESFEARYQIEGQEAVTESFQVEIESYEKTQVAFETPAFLFPGDYNLSIEIVAVNGSDDQDPSNNSAEKEVEVCIGVAQRIPMIEHFSSSTCYPCVHVNVGMDALTAANPGKYTYTKYPMNGPAPGDPYYTNECGTRRTYYNVNSVPQIFLDGLNVDAPVTQEKLDNRYNTPAVVNIRGAFEVEGSTIKVTADFMAYTNISNARAYISVNEKATTGNSLTPSEGGNGETEFHHIMMKMLESAQGKVMSISEGQYQRVEYSYDMSNTNMEDINDLEVSIWLQDLTSKNVYNSHYAYEYTDHCYPVRNLTYTASTKAEKTFSWSTPEAGTPTGYNVIVNGELVMENTQSTSYTFDYDGETFVAEVVALYADGKTSVGVVEIFGNGINVMETEESSFSIYPNPAKDVVKISAINGQSSVVRIYNVMGMMVDEIEVNTDNMEINISDYTPGIYFFNVEGEVVKVVKD